MKFLKAIISVGVMVALTAPALACDKNKTSKNDRSRQQTASQTTHSGKPGS